MSGSANQKKIGIVNTEIEQLRVKLINLEKSLLATVRTLEVKSGEQRLLRVKARIHAAKLLDLDVELVDYRARLEVDPLAHQNHQTVKSLDDLLAVTNSPNSSTSVYSAHHKLATAYASIKHLRTQAEENQANVRIATLSGHAAKFQERTSIRVNFDGRSCNVGINQTTQFAEVLKTACDYWSLAPAASVLSNGQGKVYTNSSIVCQCSGPIPDEVILKPFKVKDRVDDLDMATQSRVASHTHISEDVAGSSEHYTNKRPAPKPVPVLLYSELIVHILFWVLYIIQAVNLLHIEDIHGLNEVVTKSLFTQEFQRTKDDAITFKGIKTEADFWLWVEGPLRSSISTNGMANSEINCPDGHVSLDTNAYGTENSVGVVCYSGALNPNRPEDTTSNITTLSPATGGWAEEPADLTRPADVNYAQFSQINASRLRCTDNNRLSIATGELTYEVTNWCAGDRFNPASPANLCGRGRSEPTPKDSTSDDVLLTEEYHGNFSCLLIPAPRFAVDKNSFYAPECLIAPNLCDKRIGYYRLQRSNILHGTLMVHQYRVSANVIQTCPDPYAAPDFLNIEHCSPPFAIEPALSGGTTDFPHSEIFRDLQLNNASSMPDMFECEDPDPSLLASFIPAAFSRFNIGMKTVGGPYFPSCSFIALLPPEPANFDAAVGVMKDTGWVDEQTRALQVVGNFFNPSFNLIVVVTAICEFTAGGGLACSSEVNFVPVPTMASKFTSVAVSILVFILFAVQVVDSFQNMRNMGCRGYWGYGNMFQAKLDGLNSPGHEYAPVGGSSSAHPGGDRDSVIHLPGTKLNMFSLVAFGFIIAAFLYFLEFLRDSRAVFGYDNTELGYSGLQFNNKIEYLYENVEMRGLAMVYDFALSLNAIAIFFQTIAIFKFMILHPQMSLLCNAVDMASVQLANLTLLIIIVMFAAVLPMWYMNSTSAGSYDFRDPDFMYINAVHAKFKLAALVEEQYVSMLFSGVYIVVLMVVYGSLLASVISGSYIYLLNKVAEDGYFWFE